MASFLKRRQVRQHIFAFTVIFIFEVEGEKSTWLCDSTGCKGKSKGCKIQTAGEEHHLLYPHTVTMHRWVDITQASQEIEEAFGMHGESDNDVS